MVFAKAEPDEVQETASHLIVWQVAMPQQHAVVFKKADDHHANEEANGQMLSVDGAPTESTC